MDRPFEELSTSGLLWLINRTVFHPRGYALAITIEDGKAVGWSLLGDGSEPWQFGGDENGNFRRAEATLAGRRVTNSAPPGRGPVGTLELSKAPDGRFVIGRADQSIDISLGLLNELLGPCASNRDGLIVFVGVDETRQPREVTYREIGFNPTANPEANEGGFLMLEREP